MFTSRPYAGQHDLETLSTFLTQARSDIHRAHHLHVGDLVWQLFHMAMEPAPGGAVLLNLSRWIRSIRNIPDVRKCGPRFRDGLKMV